MNKYRRLVLVKSAKFQQINTSFTESIGRVNSILLPSPRLVTYPPRMMRHATIDPSRFPLDLTNFYHGQMCQVMNILKMELAASGLSEEEILAKTLLLMKAFGKEDAANTAEYKLLSRQKNKALVKAEIPPKDFSAVSPSRLLC